MENSLPKNRYSEYTAGMRTAPKAAGTKGERRLSRPAEAGTLTRTAGPCAQV